jgi:hypothetical protein
VGDTIHESSIAAGETSIEPVAASAAPESSAAAAAMTPTERLIVLDNLNTLIRGLTASLVG